MRTAIILLMVALLGLALGPMARAQAPAAGKRIALVIGNGAYRNVDRLANAANDARLIAATLRDLGFTLIGNDAQLDLDHAALTRAVQDFGHAIAGADVALFYYSGHGLQVQGVNWLVPVDANPTRPQDLDFQMVDADLVLRQMDGAGTKLNVVLLDACRNNPFASRGLRALQPGLAEMRAPDGTLISYATQPGNVAMDGNGANSPYTTALAATMRHPGLDIFRLFNEVGLQVKRSTGGSQQPWVSTSPIDGDFFFAPQPATAPAPAPPPGEPQPSPPPPAPNDAIAAAIHARPCSILDAKLTDGAIDLSGLAVRGADWDAFVSSLGATRGIRPGSPAVEFLPAFACPATDALAPAVRRAREGGHPRLLDAPHRDGQRVSATLRQAAGKYLAADLFSAGNTVEHLVGAPAANAERTIAFATPSPGTRLLTVVLSSTPLDLGKDAGTRNAAAYLAALAEAVRASPDALADMATFEIRAATVAAPPVSPPIAARPSRSPRCAGILERAQLGEPLSDADRAMLRAECR